MDLIIFSKDRAFQLHTALETIKKYVSGVENVYVQFAYSNQKYLDGYIKLGNMFENVTFIDESEYGFRPTLCALLNNMKSENVALNVDDIIYYEHIDLKKCSDILSSVDDVGKFTYSLNSELFDKSSFIDQGDYYVIDKVKDYGSEIKNTVLKYPFGVSWDINRVSDILELLNMHDIKNPVQLEEMGYSVFNKYRYSIYHKSEVVRYIHINNHFDRYDEICDTNVLNEYFLDGEVIDVGKIDMKEMEMDMRWFNGEDIGRFPIFPWEIQPKYHKELIDNRKKI